MILGHIFHETRGMAMANGGFSFGVQMICLIIFTLAVLYIGTRLKRWNSTCGLKAKPGKKLQVLETKPLGNRQFLLVVVYENEKFLLGVQPSGMQFLSKLENNISNKES